MPTMGTPNSQVYGIKSKDLSYKKAKAGDLTGVPKY